MDPIKTTAPPQQQQQQHLESRLDILRGAINRYSHIINTDKQHSWRKLKTQNLPRSSRIHVHKRSGGPSEIYKIELDITARADRTWTLSSWHALFQSVGTRKLWDQMINEVQVLDRPDSNTVITHRIFNGSSSSSNEGCVFAERTIRKTNMIRHIATTTTPRRDDDNNEQYTVACPALAGYDIRISPEDNSNLDSRVTFYYEIVSPTLSEDALEQYVLSLVTGPLSTLALHGAPPDILREPDSFIKSLVYNPDRRTWDLIYQVLNTTSLIEQQQHHSSSPSSSSFANPSVGKVSGGSEPTSPSSAVGSISIQSPRKGSLASSSMHWQGGAGSWDRSNTSPLQLASSLRHRRGSFMGSLLLPPSSSLSSIHTRAFHNASTKAISPTVSSSSPQQQKHVLFSSSYTFGRNTGGSGDTKSNRRMEWSRTPDLAIELDSKTWAGRSAAVDLQLQVLVPGMGELDPKMVDQFAQLCIRCYAERQPPPDDGSFYHRYFVTLYHPPQLIQYLMEENEVSLPVTGPRDEITVKLRLVPRNSGVEGIGEENAQQLDNINFALFVNGKEWPFRSWIGDSLFFDDDSSGTSSEEDEEDVDIDDNDGDHDVFVDDMEDTETSEDIVTTRKMAPSIELEPMVASQSDKTVLPSSLPSSSVNQASSIAGSKDYADTEGENMEHYDTIDDEEQQQEEEGKQEQEETEPRMSEEGEAEDIMVIPETDPEPVLRMRDYFDRLIQSEKWSVVQAPEPSNLFVTIRKLDVPGHPTGAYLSEAIWKDCSVWDVKAVVSCIGARKIWDSTYEDGVFLHQVSNTCSLWHHKMKGFWTVSARDYVAFTSAYTSASCIDLCSTSCMSDSYDHHSLPTNTPGYVRARLDLWNWRLERIDGATTSVKLINQANLQGWIPSYVPNSLSGHNPDLVMRAHQFFNKHGSPPDLTILEHGSLVNVSYDHHRQSWRCEYTRTAEDISSSSTLAEVRMRRRPGRSYNVVIDPPPSSVKASTRTHDPYGIWLEISHHESDIIPQRGKILLLIKPGMDDHQEQVVINGDTAAVDKDLVKSMRIKEKPVVNLDDDIENDDGEPPPQVMPREAPVAPATTEFIQDDEQRKAVAALGGVEETSGQKSITATIDGLPKSPEDLAQSALAFLTRVSDQQFGWSSVSDKNGLKVSKRSGTAKMTNSSAEKITQMFMGEPMEIPEPSVIVKASKVIEGFSLEEVASIVTDTGSLRKQYDEAVEEIEVLSRTRNGCQIVRQLIKGIFPFKSREIFVSACTAHEKALLTTNPSAKRILYVEASIPNFPSSSDPSKRPPALFYLSGWILEAIDPYTTTTNHPIPSMRATCLASLDLGPSVPAYMSNLVTTGLPKRMKALEKLLHSQGPPPYLGQPYAAQVFSGGKLVDELSVQGPLEWTMVDTAYDKGKSAFTCDASFRLLSSPPKKTIGNVSNKSNLSTSLLKSKQQQQQQSTYTGPMTTTSSSTTIGSNSSVASGVSSSNVTTSIASKVGSSTTARGVGGALITNIMPGEQSTPAIATTAPSTTTTTTTTKSSVSSSSRNNDVNITLLRAILDLRNYGKGYELNVTMKRSTGNGNTITTTTATTNMLMAGGGGEEKNVSSMLSVNVSELAPEPSHLITNTINQVVPRKHAVEISTKTPMLVHDKVYALKLQLIPATEECLQKRGTRLTVSGVLGEDDGQWHGVVMLNGQEIGVGSTVEVAASPIIESPTLQQSQHHIDQEEEQQQLVTDQQQQQQQPYDEANASAEHHPDESVSVLGGGGGGVVAAALGGVSASVNQIQDFRTRMLLPFRNSTSFLSSTPVGDEDDFFESPASSPSESSVDEKNAFSTSATGDGAATTTTTTTQQHVHNRRSRYRSRSTPDVVMRRTVTTVRGTTGTSAINKSGFLVIILLLLLIMMATMEIPTKEEVLDTYISATRLRQLWRIPWMNGWHIEIIAVQQQ